MCGKLSPGLCFQRSGVANLRLWTQYRISLAARDSGQSALRDSGLYKLVSRTPDIVHVLKRFEKLGKVLLNVFCFNFRIKKDLHPQSVNNFVNVCSLVAKCRGFIVLR